MASASNQKQYIPPSDSKKQKHEKVVVHLRLRPPNSEEKQTSIEIFDPQRKYIQIKKDSVERKTFQLDSLMDPYISQEQVFHQVATPVINTGTGKTHTMVGNYHPLQNDSRGIIPRSLEYIFEKINQNGQESDLMSAGSSNNNGYTYDVQVAFIQIYMEMLQNLLDPESNDVKIREDPLQGVFISGLNWIPINSTKKGMQVFANGEKNRSTSFTKLNAHSSRSHAVFMVKIERRKEFKLQNFDNNKKFKNQGSVEQMTQSMLYLVDLAGSERVKKSMVSQGRLDEAKKINFSLAALGNCIHALTEQKSNNHVPFRDSKLTRILSDSLGGNSKTALIVTIGPSKDHVEETIMSLQFAQRAMKVENIPVINKKVDYRVLNVQLQSELDEINDKLTQLQIRYCQVLEKLEETQKENEKLKAQSKVKQNLNQSMVSESDQSQLKLFYEDLLRQKDVEHKCFLEDIDNLIATQELNLQTLKHENASFKEQLQSLNSLEKDKTELENRIIELSQDLEKSKKMEQKLKIQNTVKQSRLRQEFEKDSQVIITKMEGLDREIEAKEESNLELQNSLKLQIKNQEHKNLEMQNNLQEKEAQIKLKQQYIDQLDQKVIRLESDNKSLSDLQQNQIQEKLDFINELEQQNLKLKKTLDKQLSDKTTSNLNLEQKLFKNKRNYQQNIKGLEDQIQTLQSQIDEKSQQLSSNEKLIAKQNDQQLNLQNDFSLLQQKQDTLSEQLFQKQNMITQLQSQQDEINSQNQNLTEDAQTVGNQFFDLQSQYQDLEAQMQNLKDTYEIMSQHANDSISALTQEKQEIIDQNQALISQRDDLQMQREEMQNQNQILQNELAILKVQLQEKQNKLSFSEKLKNESEEINEVKISNLKEIIKDKEEIIQQYNQEVQDLLERVKEMNINREKMVQQIQNLKSQSGEKNAQMDNELENLRIQHQQNIESLKQQFDSAISQIQKDHNSTIQKIKINDLSMGLSEYLLESQFLKLEKQSQQDKIQKLEALVKQKRDASICFSTQILRAYEQNQPNNNRDIAEQVQDTIDSMITIVEIEDMVHKNLNYSSHQSLDLTMSSGLGQTIIMQSSQMCNADTTMNYLNQYILGIPTLPTLSGNLVKYHQKELQYREYMRGFIQMLLFIRNHAERKQEKDKEQISKLKKRLMSTLKQFEQYKLSHQRKEQFSGKLDRAARVIQRYWRKQKSQQLIKESNKVTHKLIQEKMQAAEAQWLLEENQIQTGKFMIRKSLTQVDDFMSILVKEFIHKRTVVAPLQLNLGIQSKFSKLASQVNQITKVDSNVHNLHVQKRKNSSNNMVKNEYSNKTSARRQSSLSKIGSYFNSQVTSHNVSLQSSQIKNTYGDAHENTFDTQN
eukprot:403375673